MIYHIVLDLLVYTLIAALASWFYYSYRQRALIGGFWGGLMVGVVGAVITTLLFTVYDWFTRLFIWLMVPKIGGDFHFRVNIVTAMIGAFLFVSILNRINHNRDRDQP